MPGSPSYDDIEQAIAQVGAQWQAQRTSVAALPPEQRRRRLGYTPGPHDIPLNQREQEASVTAAGAEAIAASGAPPAYDLRNVNGRNFTTPVKDQGACGSCVAFGTCATVEGTLKVLSGNPDLTVDLSEAQLFYCGARKQGFNCDSGWYPDAALDYVESNGIADESCYAYTPQDQNCTGLCADWRRRATYVTGWRQLSGTAAMKAWISSRGPLVTCFNVYDDFYSYGQGIYHHVTGEEVGGHCVSVVGYDDAHKCWICKNSWGSDWGEHGFFRIRYGQCGIDATMWAVESVVQSKTTLHAGAVGAPGLANLGDERLVLAWTGTDQARHLNVMTSADGWSFGDKVTLDERSIDGPGCAAGDGRVYLAWTSQGPSSAVTVMSSADGKSFGNKVTLAGVSPYGPAVAYGNGRLFIAWTETSNHRVSMISSADGVSWGTKTTLPETTVGRPGLAFANGTLYLLWAGNDARHRINLMSSADGVSWTGKVTLSESSGTAPSLAASTRMHLAWAGVDSAHHLNELVGTGPSSLGIKRTHRDTSSAGPAMVTFGGRTYLAWTGNDPHHQVHIMRND